MAPTKVVETAPDDYDLQRGWADVLQAFAKTAKIELRPDRILTPEDVIAQLKSKRDKDDADSAKYKVVKDVLGKTLACIQTLGGIAASGASMVFGPANLAYSGLSYLITAGQNYSNIFSSLEVLLKQVSDVMERMVVYLKMKEVDKPLRKIVHELLQNIISVCALSIKVLHGNKILKFLKVFAFSEDDGVKGALDELKTIVDRESQMKTTLTYAIVKEGLADANEAVTGVRGVVDKLADESKRRELESADRKQLEKIRATLGVQKEVEAQVQLHSRLWSETVHETGQWLQEEESYQQWADRNTNFNKVVFLSADEGFGKTFLTTSAIHSLHKRYGRQTDDAARTMVAYYHLLPKDSKSTHGTEEEVFSVDRVMKTIALQFAQDPVYRKELMVQCEKWIEPETTEELVMRLLDPCYRSQEVFYMVIDGLPPDEKQLSGLSHLLKGVSTRFTPEQQSHVRLLFSGRVSLTDSLASELEYPNFVIDVASSNRPDIEKFTRDRLSTLKLLQGESEQIKTLRQEVFDVLTTEAKGDFVNIDLLLKEISTKQWPAEIRAVLEKAKAGSNRSETIAREIERCNDTLSAQEIQDLNTMLTWVLAAKSPLRVGQLSAILFLKNGESSLRPLHERIREKYSSFFHLDEVYGIEAEAGYLVSLVSDSIRDYFKAQDSEVQSGDDNTKILESEVKIVRRFLTSVCDQELYNKFGFDSFFASKLSNANALIDVDLERASSTLLLGCLQGLISAAPELSQLWFYGIDYFPAHLADVDLAMTDPAIKMVIGKILISLFTEEDIIARWWTAQSIPIRTWWMLHDKNVETVLSWFKDSAVIKGFSDSKRAWVNSLTSNSSPNADLLEHIIKHLCKQVFLANRFMPIKEAYSAIAGYRRKLKRRTDDSIVRLELDLEDDDVSSDDVLEDSKWAADLLGVEYDKDYQWNRCTARLLRLYAEVDEAITYYKKAITLADDAWYAELGLANAYGNKGQAQDAIDIAEGLKDRLKEGVPQVEEPELAMVELRNSLAGWYRDVKRYDEALSIFDEGLAENGDNYWLYNEKLLVFHAMGSYQQIFDMLEELAAHRDVSVGISRRSRLWHCMAFKDEFYDKIKEAAKKTDQTALLLSIMHQAVEDAVNPLYLPLAEVIKALWREVITYYADQIRWEIAKTEEERNAVVESMEKNIHDCADSNVVVLRDLIAKRLAQVYVDRLRALTDDSPEIQTTLKKLSDLTFDETAERDDSVNTNLLMARYESVRGDQESAMKLTRGIVKIGLDLLSDEDPDNDWQGYQRLATVLTYYGDDDNALAAWSLLGPIEEEEDDAADEQTEPKEDGLPIINGETANVTVELTTKGETAAVHIEPITNGEAAKANDAETTEDKTTTTEEQEDSNEPTGPLCYSCDGGCEPTTIWTYASNMYACKDCLDVMFDENCLNLLREGKLPINVCNPNHEFLHVPKWDPKEAEKRGKDHVRLRGEAVPVADWLNQLRKTWGFDQPTPPETAEVKEDEDSPVEANASTGEESRHQLEETERESSALV